jgi:hypothetical protein
MVMLLRGTKGSEDGVESWHACVLKICLIVGAWLDFWTLVLELIL